jgi:3'(2'), 5'-bisphosphate nucleotidase
MKNRSEELAAKLDLSSLDLDAIAHVFAKLAIEAGAAIMKLYGSDANARAKADQSPVCDADLAAESVILKGLAAELPHIAVISEEGTAAGAALTENSTFILVDPLDGTREFLSRNGEFTVNIALIIDGVPRAGVVYAPALGRLWIAGSHAETVQVAPDEPLPPAEKRQSLHVRKAPKDGLVALASRSHADSNTDAFLARLPIKERQPAGSSLKFCRVAEGVADVYPRFGPTMEWDTAAGDAVLRVAGGTVRDIAGPPLRFGKFADRLINGAFVAWGDPEPAATYAGAKTA